MAWTTVMGVCALLVATVATAPVVDAALIGIAGVVGVGGAGLGWLRHRTLTLPLRLAEHGCRGMLGGIPVYRFRACLGRGRPFSAGRATVEWVAGDARVSLPVTLAHLPTGVGPWTVVVTDPERVASGDGAFVVRVSLVEGSRQWAIEETFAADELVEGAFGADVQVSSDGLQLDPDRWDAVRHEAWT